LPLDRALLFLETMASDLSARCCHRRPLRLAIIPVSPARPILGVRSSRHHEEVIGGKQAKPIREPAALAAVALG
jgi:hypothetical protein